MDYKFKVLPEQHDEVMQALEDVGVRWFSGHRPTELRYRGATGYGVKGRSMCTLEGSAFDDDYAMDITDG